MNIVQTINTFERAGLPVSTHHFINENLLLTFALTGKAKPPVDRNALDAQWLKLLGEIETMNGNLILAGMPYDQRKEVCRRFVANAGALPLMEVLQ